MANRYEAGRELSLHQRQEFAGLRVEAGVKAFKRKVEGSVEMLAGAAITSVSTRLGLGLVAAAIYTFSRAHIEEYKVHVINSLLGSEYKDPSKTYLTGR